jgi:hypothetical protein
MPNTPKGDDNFLAGNAAHMIAFSNEIPPEHLVETLFIT